MTTTKTQNAKRPTPAELRRFGWRRLAEIYRHATPAVRQAIVNEARRCGYTPRVVLGVNSWQR